MNSSLFFAITVIAALGCGLIAGIFFAFSSFVMKALCRLSAPEAIAAMQFINVAVLNAWFLGVFLGTAGVGAAAIILSLLRWREPSSAYLLAGSLFYLVGCLGVTIGCNVLRND